MGPVSIKGAIPDSAIPYPDGLLDRIKYFIWKIVSPSYVFIMNTLLRLHVIRHTVARQNFVIGKLEKGARLKDFLRHLEAQGWRNHFVAWHDDGQVVSVRKPVGFTWQYHLRVFEDGEVRGHYEYTPESHPLKHLLEVGLEERREDFLRAVGDWVVPTDGSVARTDMRVPARPSTRILESSRS